jgi:serine/threonine protein kinase
VTQDRTRDRKSSGARADASTLDLSGRCVGSSYLLVRPIGQGATGTVWQGVDRASGESVAVKLLHESLLRQPKLVTRFVQERTILLMLRHRNVVRVRDLFSVGETLGLVMDLVPGGSLRDHLREHHTIDAPEAARLAGQVAAALAEAHELGVIHRDLKPDNILLRVEDGRLDTRLTDFGVARILNVPSMTTPNAVVGTPHYMSPEAFHGSTASPATDVYALGVLLYEMVCGRPPYDSDSLPDLMRHHLEGNPERRPGIPDPLWEVIEACLEQKPRLRPSAAELVADLADVARATCGVAALPPPARTPPPALTPPPAMTPPPVPASVPPPESAAPPDVAPPDVARPSIVPAQRRPRPRNQAPSWRWARPGATMSLIAGAMLASAVATTAWHLTRPDDHPAEAVPPQVIAQPAVKIQQHPAATTTSRSAARPAPKRPAASVQPRPAGPAVVPQTTAAVRATRTAATRSAARKPQPEAKPYGPWQCDRRFAFDLATNTPLSPMPCRMTGHDIQFRGALTAPGGAGATLEVSVQDTAGRTVAGPKTCDGLTFAVDGATQGCGPFAASPARGRDYQVVLRYRYTRNGSTVDGTSKGSIFSW